jgi:hypothetical protein
MKLTFSCFEDLDTRWSPYVRARTFMRITILTASQGTFSSRLTDAPIALRESALSAMAASGSVVYNALPSKRNVSSTLSVWPSLEIPTFVTLTCYMLGVNGESSFEAALLKRLPHCEVWGYDFSVGGVRASCFFFPFPLYRRPFTHPFYIFG